MAWKKYVRQPSNRSNKLQHIMSKLNGETCIKRCCYQKPQIINSSGSEKSNQYIENNPWKIHFFSKKNKAKYPKCLCKQLFEFLRGIDEEIQDDTTAKVENIQDEIKNIIKTKNAAVEAVSKVRDKITQTDEVGVCVYENYIEKLLCPNDISKRNDHIINTTTVATETLTSLTNSLGTINCTLQCILNSLQKQEELLAKHKYENKLSNKEYLHTLPKQNSIGDFENNLNSNLKHNLRGRQSFPIISSQRLLNKDTRRQSRPTGSLIRDSRSRKRLSLEEDRKIFRMRNTEKAQKLNISLPISIQPKSLPPFCNLKLYGMLGSSVSNNDRLFDNNNSNIISNTSKENFPCVLQPKSNSSILSAMAGSRFQYETRNVYPHFLMVPKKYHTNIKVHADKTNNGGSRFYGAMSETIVYGSRSHNKDDNRNDQSDMNTNVSQANNNGLNISL